MVRANAFLNERDYVIPADVEDVFYDVTKHRIVLNTKARVTGVSGEAVLEKLWKIPQNQLRLREKSSLWQQD